MATETSTFVIDAWPVLKLYRLREPAASLFQSFLHEAALNGWLLLMFRINYGEIRYKALDYLDEQRALRLVSQLPRLVNIVSVDDNLVDEAATLKHAHRFGYADAFAAALATRHDAAVVTGDPHFLTLQAAGVIKVRWLGA